MTFSISKSLQSNIARLGMGQQRLALTPWMRELIFLFVPFLLIELALPGSARLAAMHPHPFWIPVLLMATQHGLGAGLSAAGLATVIASIIGWPVQAGAEDLYDYSNRVWREPIMWIGASVVLGCLREQQLDKMSSLRSRLVEANVQRQRVAAEFQDLCAHLEGVERRMATTEDRSLSSAHAALQSLAVAEPDNARDALATAMGIWVGRSVYRVFERRDDKFVAHSGLGNSNAEVPMPADLEAALVRNKRVITLLRPDDGGLLLGAGVAAAPIGAGGTDKVVGVLLLEQIDPARINEQLEVALSVVASALAPQIGKSQVVINFERDRGIARSANADDGSAASPVRSADVMNLPVLGARVAL